MEKLPRVGDSWRNRYDTVTAHTPIYTDHYPFLRFPDNWPRWLPGDKIADWMEHYSQIMGLDVMLNTHVTGVEYNESTRSFSVKVQTKDDGNRSLTARHVVLATGVFSPVPVKPQFPNEKSFKGQVYHTAEHKSAGQVDNVRDKKIVLIGSGTSAHDVAQDFVNHGAKEVSMMQRGPIFSVTSESISQTMFSLWNTPGLSTEEADVMANSLPLPVVRTMGVGQTQMMSQMDKAVFDGMEKAGLALRRGEDGVGLVDHQVVKVGHFYIDQGAIAMIIDGRIKIHRCEDGVKEFYDQGIVLANGKRVEADVVVFATGFERSDKIVEQIMGKDVKQKIGDIGLVGEDQERIGVSGHHSKL